MILFVLLFFFFSFFLSFALLASKPSTMCFLCANTIQAFYHHQSYCGMKISFLLISDCVDGTNEIKMEQDKFSFVVMSQYFWFVANIPRLVYRFCFEGRLSEIITVCILFAKQFLRNKLLRITLAIEFLGPPSIRIQCQSQCNEEEREIIRGKTRTGNEQMIQPLDW